MSFFLQSLILLFLKLAFFLELPVEFFKSFDFLFFTVSRNLCTDSVPLLLILFVLLIDHRHIGRHSLLMNNCFSVFGSFSFQFIFLFKDFSFNQFEIHSFESRIVVNCEDDIVERSVADIDDMLEIAHNLNN